MSEVYYGVIYFADGRRYETGGCGGAGAERTAETLTAMQFEQEMRVWERSGLPSFFKPTRYEVKRREV